MNRHSLSERRGFIKRRGLLTCLLGAGCLLLGLAFGSREFFILTAILCALLLLALLQAALQRPRIRLDLGSGQVIRAQAKALALKVYNPRLWPLFPLRLRLSLLREGQAPAELANLEIALKGHEEKTLPIEAVCPHRGEYQVLLQRYYAEDVFSLFALAGLALPPQSLLALPQLDLAALEEPENAAREDDDSLQGRQGQQGQLTAESRLYQPGDALHAIHWKKSASRRELMSRLREYAADYSSCLLVDNRPFTAGEEGADYEDRLTEAALSFLFTQLSGQQAITLLPGGLALQSPQDLAKAAELLALLPFNADGTFVALKSLLQGQRLPDTLYIALAQPPLLLSELLEQLIDRGCSVCCVCPAAAAPALENGLTLALPLVSIDPPLTLSNWLEV